MQTLAKWMHGLTRTWERLSQSSYYVVLYGPADRYGVVEWRSVRRPADSDKPGTSTSLTRYISLAVMPSQLLWRVELRVAAEDARGFGHRPVARAEAMEGEVLESWLTTHWDDAVAAANDMGLSELTSAHLPNRMVAESRERLSWRELSDEQPSSGEMSIEALFHQMQESFIKAVDVWTDLIGKAVPTKRPQTAERGYEEITELIDQSFASFHRVVEAQKEFADQVLRTAREVSTAAEGDLRSERRE